MNYMNTTFSYNANAKYSTQDLKGGHNNINILFLHMYFDEKGSCAKIQLSNIFKHHHVLAKPSSTPEGYDEWPLSNALCMKFYNSHDKHKPESNEYFYMYQCQLSFALFCATSALGISWQHLNHPNLLLRALYRFRVYLHVRLILHDLGIPLPHEDGFNKFKNASIKNGYYSVCDDYGVDLDETWIHEDWFNMTGYGIFGHKAKATNRSAPDNLT